jgi:putative DNA primase/helicase
MDEVLGVAGEAPELAPPESEEALAIEFAGRHAGSMRFVAQWGRWMVFDGQKWLEDTTRLAFSRAREICRTAAMMSNSKARKALASGKTRAAVVSLASDDRQLAATVDQWDRDHWLLNTPDGVIDLRTGGARPARPDDYITKITAVGRGGECPTWRSFLERVTGGDDELQAYLRRLAGYCLTGLTREHALFFAHGTGANGKSVFISTLAGILGDYCVAAPMETFTASQHDRHPTELAMLRGARLVTAVETEEGARWAESKIKAMTGGDPITARFMRQDFFQYLPSFKLLIAGNHKPRLRTVNEAMIRRFHLLPFDVTIPPEERDHDLTEKLSAEWPGILAWCIVGCREWQSQGLNPPERARAATAEYLEDEDVFGRWLEDECLRDPKAWTPTSVLYERYQKWIEASGEYYVMAERQLSQTLKERGYVPVRRDLRGFGGLALRPEGQTPM